MFAFVAASPLVASAASAATDTQLEVLMIFFCRLMTMLPIVALAVPVLVTVTTPSTVRKLALVAPFVAVTVHEIVGESSGSVMLWLAGSLSSVHSVLLAWHSSALQLVSVMLACPGAVGLGAATTGVATRARQARATSKAPTVVDRVFTFMSSGVRSLDSVPASAVLYGRSTYRRSQRAT